MTYKFFKFFSNYNVKTKKRLKINFFIILIIKLPSIYRTLKLFVGQNLCYYNKTYNKYNIVFFHISKYVINFFFLALFKNTIELLMFK